MLNNILYKKVPDCEKNDEEEINERLVDNPGSNRRLGLGLTIIIVITAVVVIVVAILAAIYYSIGGIWFNLSFFPASNSLSSCSNPIVRREWRSLRDGEKRAYLASVDCLYHTPSVLWPNSTIYEDLSWTHNFQSSLTHHTAVFLPWHRNFLQVYLNILRTHCGYRGDLVYWDWTLDFEMPSASPIFDLQLGFGGDGRFGEEENASNGTCVADGPFSHYIGLYVNDDYAPHCLSRQFGEGFFIKDTSQSPYRPEVVQRLLSAPTFEAFTEGIYELHDDVHDGVGGDLRLNTSPYDPLFFVHHTQLDRLWWLWQQQRPESKGVEYGGDNGEYAETREASLNDQMFMEPLAGALMVSSVMHTNTELLCYRY